MRAFDHVDERVLRDLLRELRVRQHAQRERIHHVRQRPVNLSGGGPIAALQRSDGDDFDLNAREVRHGNPCDPLYRCADAAKGRTSQLIGA